MRSTKVQFGCKISPLVRALISLERKTLGADSSDADALESLVLRASNSAEASNLILKEAEKDPLYAAMIGALTAKKK